LGVGRLPLDLDSRGYLGTKGSSARFKHAIKPMTSAIGGWRQPRAFWGAHAPSRAGRGASPRPLWYDYRENRDCSAKVRDGEGAIAGTRDACAPQTIPQPIADIAAFIMLRHAHR